MGEIDFFAEEYRREPLRNDEEFGIVDGREDKPAYTIDSKDGAEAMVENPNRKDIQFTPLDRNITIYKLGTQNKESLCDGMLHSGVDYIAFVELKAVKQKWVQKATAQLENTIDVFKRYHDIMQFSNRYAYAANRKHGYDVKSSHRELKSNFHNQTNCFLRLTNKIIVSEDKE